MNYVSMLLDEADGPLCVQKSLPKLTRLRVNVGDERKGSRKCKCRGGYSQSDFGLSAQKQVGVLLFIQVRTDTRAQT